MPKKLFSRNTLLLTVTGLLINISLVWLTRLFSIPLYLDSIGTTVAAALGGMLPGIAVGFLSNCITSLFAVSPDPMTLYYGFLNVLIAVLTAWLSKKGVLLRWYGKVIELFGISAIGGALGSVVTWVLYGFSFGQGVSAPLAGLYFERLHFGRFFAQFAADMSVDLIDKSITVTVLCVVIYLLPAKIMKELPLGYVYRHRKERIGPAGLKKSGNELIYEEKLFRKRSIRSRITLLMLISTSILCIISVSIGITTYKSKLTEQYSNICSEVVSMMLTRIDADKIDEYLELGESAEGYTETEEDLYDIFNNADKIKYMYVYKIERDGCHVVFDLDSDGVEGNEVGTLQQFDKSFPFVSDVIAGRDIPPVITNDTYGWLLTVYKPVRDINGNTVAYAAADIDMDSIRSNTYTFLISISSLLFGALIVIAAFSLWYCDKRLIIPINTLVEQARNFDYEGNGNEIRVRDRQSVKTGDELEELFSSMCRTEDTIAQHVTELNAKNREISLMQRNIIYTLADMVENRDSNTGDHIKRTAAYVKLIGEKLRENGLYMEHMDSAYIQKLYDSAPLHDIGKIKISDSILNKPGRLTPEEFEIIKTHTTSGRDILKSSLSGIEDKSWLSMATKMAAYHHEWWDGSGYPEGLSGTEIPLCARIMAVSDVFDALVSERSYKKAFSFEQAAQIIQEDSGKHFDPVIVKVFLESEAEIREIMNK